VHDRLAQPTLARLPAALVSTFPGGVTQTVSAGSAIVDGIAASAYTTLEEYGLVLDAVASQRFKHAVRVHPGVWTPNPRSRPRAPDRVPIDLPHVVAALVPVICP